MKQKTDENGDLVFDEDGNPVYEDGEPTGGYAPDAEAQAWHDGQVAGLKKAQSKALTNMGKQKKRADAAEARVAELEAENEALRATIGDDGHDLEERMEKLRLFEAGQLKDKGINEDDILERGRKGAERKYAPQIEAKDAQLAALQSKVDELESSNKTYRYDGRLKTASIGVIAPGYEVPGMATLKALVTENEDGDLECRDKSGEIVWDNNGHLMPLEDFLRDVFRVQFPNLCAKDTAITTNGAPGAPKSKTPNPFVKETRNALAQAQLIKNDPDKARKLMRAAGFDDAKIARLTA